MSVCTERRFGCQGRTKRLTNDVWRDPKSGRLTYHDGWGQVRTVTQELTRRGLSKEIGEPEFPIRVRPTEHGVNYTKPTALLVASALPSGAMAWQSS